MTSPTRRIRCRVFANESWWTEWSGRCTFHGEWRAPVVRSLLTLKALTFAPTGGIVAAVDDVPAGAHWGCTELGLSVLLAAGCHVHALLADGWRVSGRGQCLARMAFVGVAGTPRRCRSSMAFTATR